MIFYLGSSFSFHKCVCPCHYKPSFDYQEVAEEGKLERMEGINKWRTSEGNLLCGMLAKCFVVLKLRFKTKENN